MITKYDADMMAQMIQDHTVEDFKNVARQRDKIEEEMAHMRQLFRKLGEAHATDNNVENIPSTSQTCGENGSSE
jgi:hypothetical protein